MYFNWFFWVLRAFLFRIYSLNRVKFKYFGRPISILGIKNFATGNDVGVYPGARIEIISGELSIGEGTRIGHNFFCETSGGRIIIGKNVTISANCFIGATDYNWSTENQSKFKKKGKINRDVIIGDNVFIGFGSCILPGSIIEDNSVIGANLVVSKNEKISGVYTGKKKL
jgi:acetyltransferase-like isoleucine patch superfamily enzyme